MTETPVLDAAALAKMRERFLRMRQVSAGFDMPPDAAVQLINEALALLDALAKATEALRESRAWLCAALEMVGGDGSPPDWDGMRECVVKTDVALTSIEGAKQ